MTATTSIPQLVDQPSLKVVPQIPQDRISQRVASVDWMRGMVMVLMIIDHASAFDAHHLDHDSALFPDAMSMILPGAEFFPRWLAHLCAASFVFLMGTSLALSVERRVVRGVNAMNVAPVLHFARRLAARRRPVWLRYVLVPGWTDDVGSISQIAQFTSSLGNVERVDVLPFHQMGRFKWKEMKLDYRLEHVQPPHREVIEEACAQFRALGLKAY